MRFRVLGPGYEGLGPGCEDLGPGYEDLGPGYEDLGPGYEDFGPGYEDSGPLLEVLPEILEPRAKKSQMRPNVSLEGPAWGMWFLEPCGTGFAVFAQNCEDRANWAAEGSSGEGVGGGDLPLREHYNYVRPRVDGFWDHFKIIL